MKTNFYTTRYQMDKSNMLRQYSSLNKSQAITKTEVKKGFVTFLFTQHIVTYRGSQEYREGLTTSQ